MRDADVGSRRARPILALACVAAASQLWQRYHVPLILMLLALMACRQDARGGGFWRRVEVLGPLVLALVMGAMAAKMCLRDPPQQRGSQAELLGALYPGGGGPSALRMEPQQPRQER